jgi:hypothetical protein
MRAASTLDAANGREGWSPRAQTLSQELGTVGEACGINSKWGRLKAVLLHRPGQELAARCHFDAQPNLKLATFL